MTSIVETFVHCNYCNTDLIENNSLEIHLNYTHFKLLDMWMQEAAAPPYTMSQQEVPLSDPRSQQLLPSMNTYDRVISPQISPVHQVFDYATASPLQQSVEPPMQITYPSQEYNMSLTDNVSQGPMSSSSSNSSNHTAQSQNYLDYGPNSSAQNFESLVKEENPHRPYFGNYNFPHYPLAPLPTPSPTISVKEEIVSPGGNQDIYDMDSQTLLSQRNVNFPFQYNCYNATNNQNIARNLPGQIYGTVGVQDSNLGSQLHRFNHNINQRYFEQHPMPPPQPTLQPEDPARYGPHTSPPNTPQDNNPRSKSRRSNAKRAKSYSCILCDKWFTSQGHLKRHYGTNMHNTNMANEANGIPPIRSKVKSSTKIKSITGQMVRNSTPDISIKTEMAEITEPVVLSRPSSAYSEGPIFPCAPYNHSSFNQAIYPTVMTSFPPVPQGAFSPSIQQIPNGIVMPNTHAPYNYHNVFHSAPATPTHNSPLPSAHSVLNFNPPGLSVENFNSCCRISNSPNTDIGVIVKSEPSSPATVPEQDVSVEVNAPKPPSQEYKCQECNKTFNRMCYLTQHRSTYHDGEKPYKCTICGKKFNDETTYADHEKKHKGNKPHKCEQCIKQFNHKTDLRRHMCLHTGKKPFKCDTCQKGFIRKDHMLKHMTTHTKKINSQRVQPSPGMGNGVILMNGRATGMSSTPPHDHLAGNMIPTPNQLANGILSPPLMLTAPSHMIPQNLPVSVPAVPLNASLLSPITSNITPNGSSTTTQMVPLHSPHSPTMVQQSAAIHQMHQSAAIHQNRLSSIEMNNNVPPMHHHANTQYLQNHSLLMNHNNTHANHSLAPTVY